MAAEEVHEEEEHRVSPLELFFDLVFVFAFTQVTALMSKDPSWTGVGRGMLVLAALWWAWGSYTWLSNTLDVEEVRIRLAYFAAMAAMLVAALAVPQAFGRDAEAFAFAYLIVRVAHLALYLLATRDDAEARRVLVQAFPYWVAGPALICASAFTDGSTQAALWVLAIVIDYGGALAAKGEGWRVHAGHFAERHGLIVIVALGESIVAIGVGASEIPVDVEIIAAAALGTAVAACLWWAYFDVVALVAERKLHATSGQARAAQARDSYSYLHLPMIAGIVLFALGVKKVLGHVDEPLKTVPAFAMFGGLSLYFLAHVAFRLRNVRTVNRQRVLMAVALAACIPLATEADGLVSLAVAAGLSCALIAYEAIRFGEARRRVRAGGSMTPPS
jgi:low temperature requirement protein LtrA